MKVSLLKNPVSFCVAVCGIALVYLVSTAPSACACGESRPGKASWHWDDMTILERTRYKITGYVPFEQNGQRK
ncbi:MAG: hypothetical protein AAF701_01245 [Pseudomonadota bacterium]